MHQLFEVGRYVTILKLASPIMVGMVAINVLTLVDTAMVGTLGNSALSAVGLSGFVVALMGAPFQGIAAAVGAFTSRRLGEGDLVGSNRALPGGFFLGLVLGLPMSVLSYIYAEELYRLLVNDPSIWEEGVPYFRVVICSLVFQTFNFSFRGYWNGRHKPKVYMNALLLMVVVNILLNYAFIFGELGAPRLGTVGAAIGTLGAVMVGHVYYWFIIIPHLKAEGARLVRPTMELLTSLLKVGLPNGIQEFSMMTSLTYFLHLLGKLSTAELAAGTVMIRIALVGYLPSIGFGMAAATLVGRALGEGKPKDAARWGWEVCLLAFVCISTVGLCLLPFTKPILGVFLKDPGTLAVAVIPFTILCLRMGFAGMGFVLSYALVGAGAAKRAMTANMFNQWCFVIPLVYWGIHNGLRLPGIWMIQVGGIFLTLMIMSSLWMHGGWKKKVI